MQKYRYDGIVYIVVYNLEKVMAPLVPFIPLITGVLAAGATVASTIMSNNQAKESQERQLEYQKQLQAQEAATEAEEKRLAQEAEQRSRAYGASLINSDSTLQNNYSGSFNDEGDSLGSSSLITNGLTSVESMFA